MFSISDTIKYLRSVVGLSAVSLQMKKLAARDFEDLLQVRVTWNISYSTVLTSSSAPFPCLKGYLAVNIIAG